MSRIDDSENVHMDDATPALTDELPAASMSAEEEEGVRGIPQAFETSAVRDDVYYSEKCLDELQRRLPVLRRYLLSTAAEVEACNNLIIHYKDSKKTREDRG